jgi:hypothetical protein
MRLTTVLLPALALLTAACTGDGDPSPTPTREAQATSESPAATASPSAAAEDLVEWDSAAAEQLAALEPANDEPWTVDAALEAVALVRDGLDAGATGDAPIDLSRLAVFLLESFDDIPTEEWEALVAHSASSSGELIAFQPAGDREAYQREIEAVEADFARLTGHNIGNPIYLAVSAYEKPIDLTAITATLGDRLEGLQPFFGDDALWQQMADDVAPLLAGGREVCVAIFGQAFTRFDETRRKAALMHEVVHCHQADVHPLGRFGFYAHRVQWMDEGYAAWAGEAYVGGTSISRPWWNAYLLGGIGSQPDGFRLFASDYTAIGFYSMLGAAGVDQWAEFFPYFNGLRANSHTNPFRYQSMVAPADPAVVATWTATAAGNDSLGPPWNANAGPGSQTSIARRSPSLARENSSANVSAAPVEQRYFAFQVTTPPDGPSLITVVTKGLGTYRWTDPGWDEQHIVTNSLELSWCVGEDCVCEDGSSPAPDALVAPIASGAHPILHAAMFGGVDGAELELSVQSLEDACDEEEEPTPEAGPLDSCLFGIWNPDPQQFQDLILRFYSRFPQLAGLSLEGTIDLTFNDDGTFSHTYSGVEGAAVVDGVSYTATWSGGTFGTWEASGGVMSLTFTGSDIRVTLAPIPIAVPSPGIPTTTVEATYDCGATTLAVDPPPTPGNLWPLPEDWTKVGNVAPLN